MANPKPAQDPAEGSRETINRELKRASHQPDPPDEHMENEEGAGKATKDNDLSTGHSYPGDGDDNSKKKKS